MTTAQSGGQSAQVDMAQNACSIPQPQYVKARALARATGLHIETIRRMIARSDFPGARKVGQRWLIPRSEALAAFPALAEADFVAPGDMPGGA
jgi:hypothetical protein